MTIRVAETDAELSACFPVVAQLRPHLTLDSFRARVRSQQAEGYRIAYVEADGAPAAVAGFRFKETLNDAAVSPLMDTEIPNASPAKPSLAVRVSLACSVVDCPLAGETNNSAAAAKPTRASGLRNARPLRLAMVIPHPLCRLGSMHSL